MGAHLPAMFHPAVFQGRDAELKWNDESGKSICERASAYERHVSWREMGKQPSSGLYQGDGYSVLYLPSTLSAKDIDRIWLNICKQNGA